MMEFLNNRVRPAVGALWGAVAITLAIGASVSMAAVESPTDNPVELGREALSGAGKFPWYDRREDDVRRINTVPRQPLADRDDKWAAQPTTPAATPAGPRVDRFGPVLQWVGLSVLVILLGVIAYLIATTFLADEVSESSAVRRVVETRRDADRVEALPFQLRASGGDFLTEARRLYEAGQFSQAIVYLYSWQLVQLDRHHLLRLTKGKTNRQYLRETRRRRPSLAATLEGTMLAFEDAFFGRKTLSQETFEACWRRVDEFQAELQRLERAAA
jgi:hypothetical protein